MSQQLVPKMGASGRVLALEVLVPNAAIRNLIREDKVHQIYSQMQVGQEKFGMQTLNQALYSLWSKRTISLEEAMMRSVEPDELRMMIERGTAGANRAAGGAAGGAARG
jgi:twitching motility protein PilT